MNQIKDTNPKDALGIKKVPLHSIPCGVLMELGLAMMEGGRKYGSHNYRKIGVRASVYYDAVMRHLMSWWEGENIDPDSGLSHIIKAMASLLVLRDSMTLENWDDDRPIQNKLNMELLNKKAEKIIEQYPDCMKPFIEKQILTEKLCKDCRHFSIPGLAMCSRCRDKNNWESWGTRR